MVISGQILSLMSYITCLNVMLYFRMFHKANSLQLILLNKRGLDSGGGGLILLSAETPLVFSQ